MSENRLPGDYIKAQRAVIEEEDEPGRHRNIIAVVKKQ